MTDAVKMLPRDLFRIDLGMLDIRSCNTKNGVYKSKSCNWSTSGVSKLFSRRARFDNVKVTEGQQLLMVLFCTIKDAY